MFCLILRSNLHGCKDGNENMCACRDLEEALEMGVDWSLREGYAWAEDKEHCEEYGRMLQADPNKVSSKAKKRGLPQVRSHSHTRPHTLAICSGVAVTLQ